MSAILWSVGETLGMRTIHGNPGRAERHERPERARDSELEGAFEPGHGCPAGGAEAGQQPGPLRQRSSRSFCVFLSFPDVWITEMYAEAKATTAGLVQFWLCGDHNSALVLNHPVMKPCKLAISWVSALHWASFELGKCTIGFYHSFHLLLVWVQLLGLKTGLFVFIWLWSVHAVILCQIKQCSTVTDFFTLIALCL